MTSFFVQTLRQKSFKAPSLQSYLLNWVHYCTSEVAYTSLILRFGGNVFLWWIAEALLYRFACIFQLCNISMNISITV